MAVKNSVQAIVMTSIDSSTINGSYQAINSGLSNACFLVRIINASTKDVTVSYDGSDDHDYIIAGNTVQISFQTNAQPNTKIANLSAGTIIYVKGTAGVGNIYLTGYFQPQPK